MLRVAPLALLILAAKPQPGPTTFRQVASRARPSLGVLICGRTRSSAVIAGGSGQVLTSALPCAKGDARLQLADKRELPLTRVRADAELGLQLFTLPHGSYPAAPAARHAAFKGDWIVAVSAGARAPRAAAGMLDGPDPKSPERVLIDAPTHPGAGVFSLEGKLVGIAVSPAPRHRMRVVPIDSIRDWLAGAIASSASHGGAK